MRSTPSSRPSRGAKTTAIAAKNQIAALRTQNHPRPKIWTGWADRGQTCPVRYNCNYQPKTTKYNTYIATGQTGQTYYIRVCGRIIYHRQGPIMRHGGSIRARTRVIAGCVHPVQSSFCTTIHILAISALFLSHFWAGPPCPKSAHLVQSRFSGRF